MSAGDWKDFYQATVRGDLALVAHHLQEGVNPNYQHPEVLRTVLVASVLEGRVEMARCLLEHGADPNLVSCMDGLSPLEAALKTGHHELAGLLRQFGARQSPRPFWRRWLNAWRVV